jgi:hypothetical protein
VKRIAIFVFLAVAAFLAMPSSAWAWGCEGHQVIALLAEKHLNPRALAMVKQILNDGPIDPALNRYCKEGGIDEMADASTWADDIRTVRPETGPWHYIDIPLGSSHADISKYCAPSESCVTQAITNQIAILRQSGIDPEKRAEALRYLIHFVGDLHQPMHATTNNDQGGNCVPVAYFDALPELRNPQTESYAPNLHGIWDTNILGRETTGKTVDQVAGEFDRAFASEEIVYSRGRVDVNAWAAESFRIAKTIAYGKLPAAIPVETLKPLTSCADDDHIAARMLKLNEQIAQPYQEVAAHFVEQRIATAGARLALVLNQLWPS